MKAKHWLKICIFAVVIAALTVAASFFLRVPEARDSAGMYGFYLEEESSLDVILIGPSTVYTGFYSPLAYEKAGFTSYAMATGALCGTMYPSAIREALTTQDPDLFVVEISSFCEKSQYNPGALRRWLDCIKDGENRDRSIEELVPEEERYSYRLPFLKYHSNWPDFSSCFWTMIDKTEQRRRGYSVTKKFTVYTGIDQTELKEHVYDFTEEGMTALRDLLTFLKENGIDNVLFVRFPYKGIIKDGDRYIAGVEKILACGYDVLDYCGNTKNVHKEDLHLDPQLDYHDIDHLTVFGAEKLTENLAAYIIREYDIHTVHSEQTKKEWDDCASYNSHFFEKMKNETLKPGDKEIFMQRDFLR